MALTPLEHPDACRMQDIMSIMQPSCMQSLQKANCYADQKHIIEREMPAKDFSCQKHFQQCQASEEDLNISGSHCSDHSKAGSQAGREGETAHFFLVLCKHLKLRQIKMALLENVVAGEFAALVCLEKNNSF